MTQIPTNKKCDLAQLAIELSAALGFPVALCGRQPGQTDNDGHPLAAVIELIDPVTGKRLSVFDAAKVQAVVVAHIPPSPPADPAVALGKSIRAAATLADVKTAIAMFADIMAQKGQHDGQQ